MTRAYVVTEGKSGQMILDLLLPESLAKDTKVIFGSGRYSAEALATTILAEKRRPVALVINTATDNERAIGEDIGFLEEWLSRISANVPFKVIPAVPQMEAVFFQDKSVLEQTGVGKTLGDEEWAASRNRPKMSLREVLDERSTQIGKMLDGLPMETIELLRRHPLVSELRNFLSEATQPSRGMQPKAEHPEVGAVSRLRAIRERQDLPHCDKKELIRKEVLGLLEARNAELDATLRTRKRRVAADERVMASRIENEEEFVDRIRQEFVGMLGSLGVEVEMSQIKCLRDFGRQISEFKRNLEDADIDDDVRGAILEDAKAGFASVRRKLADMAAELASKMQ